MLLPRPTPAERLAVIAMPSRLWLVDGVLVPGVRQIGDDRSSFGDGGVQSGVNLFKAAVVGVEGSRPREWCTESDTA